MSGAGERRGTVLGTVPGTVPSPLRELRRFPGGVLYLAPEPEERFRALAPAEGWSVRARLRFGS